MSTHKCELCEKVFKQKGDLTKHKNRASPCISLNKLKDLASGKSKLNITTALNKCLNILRDDGNVIGEDALHIISYFLIIALMEPRLEELDMYNETYYDFSICNINKDKLFNVLKFTNLIKTDPRDHYAYLNNLWYIILSKHPNTKDIFKEDKSFGINKEDVLTDILKTLTELDFKNIDSDILGDCYEEVIKNTLLQGDGQFFTPPFIKDIVVSLVDPQVFDDGTIETVYDPAMGTGGFLLTCMKYIRDKAKIKNIKLDWNQITSVGLGGREVIEKTFQFAKANCLVYSGQIFTTLDLDDSIRNPIIQKYDCIVENCPYGIKGLSYAKIAKKKEEQELRDEYLPIVSNSAVPLFIQATIYMLKTNGRAGIVIPNGQELFSKSTDLLNVRTFLMKTCDLKEVIYFNEKSFKKTSIKVCVLYFVKKTDGKDIITIKQKFNKKDEEEFDNRTYEYNDVHNTTSVKFYDYEQKTNSKKLLLDVPIDVIVNNNYSLNYKDYLEKKKEEYNNNVVVKTLGEVCDIDKNVKKHPTEYGRLNGKYKFHTGGLRTDLYVDECDIDELYIIQNRTNGSGKCNLFIDKNFSLAKQTMVYIAKNRNEITTKYVYYYLNANINILENGFIGANHKNISHEYLSNVPIPIPSLENQKEIVSYLDFIYEKCNKTSNEKIDELKRLNEFCLNNQRIFGDNVMKTLGEVCEFKNGKGIKKENLIDGEYPVIGGGQKPMGSHNEYNTNENVILCSSSGAYAGYISKYNTKVWASDCFSIKPSDGSINNDYLYYILKLLFQDKIYKSQTGTAQPHVYSKNLEKLKIPVPSLETQKTIIDYCESNNNLIKQLENEIEQNRKQANIFLSSIVKKVKQDDILQETNNDSENIESENEKVIVI